MVKECRALRPASKRDDTDEARGMKAAARREIRTAVTRSQTDRVEAWLAAVGWNAMHYVLTFAPENRPKSYDGVRRALKSFMQAVRQERKKGGQSATLACVIIIEGLHEPYHVHLIADADELPYETAQRLWWRGLVKPPEWVLLDKSGFYRLARYFCKEKADDFRIPVGKQPRSCSRALRERLSEVERWRSESGIIRAPENAICFSTPTGAPAVFDNGWGCYAKLRYLVPDGTRACKRAMKRMGYRV